MARSCARPQRGLRKLSGGLRITPRGRGSSHFSFAGPHVVRPRLRHSAAPALFPNVAVGDSGLGARGGHFFARTDGAFEQISDILTDHVAGRAGEIFAQTAALFRLFGKAACERGYVYAAKPGPCGQRRAYWIPAAQPSGKILRRICRRSPLRRRTQRRRITPGGNFTHAGPKPSAS